MRFSIAFLNCGPRPKKGHAKNWAKIASTLHKAIGNELSILGLCEIYGDDTESLVTALRDETGRSYERLLSAPIPGAPHLGVLVESKLGRIRNLGDDGAFRHGKEWKRWLAGRVEFFRPGTSSPSLLQLVVVVNHWDSITSGLQDTMADREILAWEVGSWMCSKDPGKPQVMQDPDTKQFVPAYRQPSLVMGDFNCEPGSPELRSRRKFTLQAMRNQPEQWGDILPESKEDQDTKAMLYDLSWRRLAVPVNYKLTGTYERKNDIHSPTMLDRMLVSRNLWDGPDLKVVRDGDDQAMRIIPAVDDCSDHCAIAITIETK